jgi:hypothetical protein
MMDIGVAKPSAQGQAMMSTATALMNQYTLAFPQFSRHSIMSKLDWSERNEENEIHA